MSASQSDEPENAPLAPEPSPGAQPPLTLSQLLALARTHTIDEQSAALDRVESGIAPLAEPAGDPYLLFTVADVHCAAPLTTFREVLPALPSTIALPYSPPWMLGLFALHTELIGLVDPAPFLFDAPELSSVSRARLQHGRTIRPGATSSRGQNWRLATPESGPTALITGSGERMLALAVGPVGDIAYIESDAIQRDTGNTDDNDGSVASQMTVAPRFLAGRFQQPSGQTISHIVKIDALLDVVMDALMSVEAASHE